MTDKFVPAQQQQKPVAWRYELANARIWHDRVPGEYTDWRWKVTEHEPNAGAGMRNVTPLYAHPTSVPPQERADYSAWLIEINQSASVGPTSGPIYFHYEYDDDWTTDHDKATHFARKQDAQSVIDHYGWTEAKPVEHMWPSPRSQEVKGPGK